MKKVILNPHNIALDDIEIKEERVKVLPINSDNKLLLCRINGIYHFVGGHPDPNESINECAKRETLEETGIECEPDEFVPFLQLQEFHSNYFETGKKALSTITYMCVSTDKIYDYSNRKLDEKEALKDFALQYIPLNNVITTLEGNRELAKNKNKVFLIDEMCDVINEFYSAYNLQELNVKIISKRC